MYNALSRATPPLGARGTAYGSELYTPTLRLAMWHALADTRGLRPSSVHPNHPAAPSRRRAPGTCLRLGRKFRDRKAAVHITKLWFLSFGNRTQNSRESVRERRPRPPVMDQIPNKTLSGSPSLSGSLSLSSTYFYFIMMMGLGSTVTHLFIFLRAVMV